MSTHTHADQHSHGHGHGHAQQPPAAVLPTSPADHDVVVVGGGAAGLAGALSLGRARRSVLVVDAGEQRNLPAHAVQNFLTRDGTPPAELYATARAEVASYGVGLLDARVVAARPWDHEGTGFVLTVEEDGATREVTARRLLVTTGLVDLLPEIAGLRERWGKDVVHCPYCHGFEVQDRKIVVRGSNAMAAHGGLLWRQWSDDVTLLVDPSVELSSEDAEKLSARGVTLVTGEASGLVVTDDALSGVRLTDGRELDAEVFVCATEVAARSELLEQLGVETGVMEMNGIRFGTRVEVSPTGATSVPGVYAAGNVTDPVGQVITAAAAGTWAGAQLNMELVTEEAALAVVAARAELFERPAWETRYDGPDHVWSGRVNAVLATEAADLTPGRALDIGSGEGGDAIWLAEQGWDVTGLEFSSTGRARAAAAATSHGVGERVAFRDVDAREFDAGDERWDLVTSHFLHLPDGGMLDVTRRLAAAVAPGGTLLVVGHHPQDMPLSRAQHCFTAEELVPALDPAEWEVTAETRARTAPARDGSGDTTWHDAILRATRRTD